MSITHRTSSNRLKTSSYKKTSVWCPLIQGSVHFCAHQTCHQYHHEAIRRRSRAPQKNILVCEEHHQPAGVCLTSTYFIFQGRYFEQQEGAAMGSPICPIVTNVYFEEFENKAINLAPQPPFSGEDLWMTHAPSSSHPRGQVSLNI